MDYLFDEHLKVCKQCREHPLETCAEGWYLLKRIVASPLPRPTKRVPDAGDSAASQAFLPQSGESTPEVNPAATQRG